jgi:hypothetical protein
MRYFLLGIILLGINIFPIIACPVIPTIKISVVDKSGFTIDSLWIYTDSAISKRPSILGTFDSKLLNSTITTFCMDDNFKIRIRLKNGKKFNSAAIKRKGDLDEFKVVVYDDSIKVSKTYFHLIIKYLKNALFVFLLVFVLKVMINMYILKPTNRTRYAIITFLINLTYLISQILIIRALPGSIHFMLLLHISIVMGFIFNIFLDTFISMKILRDNCKLSLIIVSATISNLIFYILGIVLFFIYYTI